MLDVDGSVSVSTGNAFRKALLATTRFCAVEADQEESATCVHVWLSAQIEYFTSPDQDPLEGVTDSPIVFAFLGDEPEDTLVSRALAHPGVWTLVTNDNVQGLAKCVLDVCVRLATVQALRSSELVSQNLVGCSCRWSDFLLEFLWVAKFSSSTVHIQGETGTGKELLARLLHTLDDRPEKGNLIVVDCTTLDPELSGSEIFGHERGAFTGAVARREGAAELADGGTLFLDEIGDLPLSVQARLLRLLQEGTYKSVGAANWKRSQFRLVSATHRDLCELVREGIFREDLYFRVCGWTTRVPSLRERKEDIKPLCEHFLHQLGFEGGVSQRLLGLLCEYKFPGNVRQLRQILAQACVRHVGSHSICLSDLGSSGLHSTRSNETANVEEEKAGLKMSPNSLEASIREWVEHRISLSEIERRVGEIAIREAIKIDGQRGKAAERLGVTPRTLQNRYAGALHSSAVLRGG
jgi:transcriptional regulator with GAF, ATPase, and Fis domain